MAGKVPRAREQQSKRVTYPAGRTHPPCAAYNLPRPKHKQSTLRSRFYLRVPLARNHSTSPRDPGEVGRAPRRVRREHSPPAHGLLSPRNAGLRRREEDNNGGQDLTSKPLSKRGPSAAAGIPRRLRVRTRDPASDVCVMLGVSLASTAQEGETTRTDEARDAAPIGRAGTSLTCCKTASRRRPAVGSAGCDSRPNLPPSATRAQQRRGDKQRDSLGSGGAAPTLTRAKACTAHGTQSITYPRRRRLPLRIFARASPRRAQREECA